MNKDSKADSNWRILSFDIGIKTLAFCMLSWNGERYRIHDWDVINLIPETIKPTCHYSIQYRGKRAKELGYSQRICGLAASFRDGPDGGGVFCRKHLTRPVTDYQEIKIQRVDRLSDLEINLAMVRELDIRPDLLDCDEILLEHQPSKNPMMKKLSSMIYSYFVIRGLVDYPDSRMKNLQIRQINSSKKLALYDGPAVDCKTTDTYRKNKTLSKIYCDYILEHQVIEADPWLLLYRSAKKKDDLADSFLQGAWFVKKYHEDQEKQRLREERERLRQEKKKEKERAAMEKKKEKEKKSLKNE